MHADRVRSEELALYARAARHHQQHVRASAHRPMLELVEQLRSLRLAAREGHMTDIEYAKQRQHLARKVLALPEDGSGATADSEPPATEMQRAWLSLIAALVDVIELHAGQSYCSKQSHCRAEGGTQKKKHVTIAETPRPDRDHPAQKPTPSVPPAPSAPPAPAQLPDKPASAARARVAPRKALVRVKVSRHGQIDEDFASVLDESGFRLAPNRGSASEVLADRRDGTEDAIISIWLLGRF